ncbi:MAG: hypothetical protein ACOH2H_04715 [Cypionkella sp.]
MLKSVLLALPFGLSVMAVPEMVNAETVDLVQRDAACTHIATVQYLDCEVAVLYTCPAVNGLAGPLVREEGYTDQGYDHFEVDTANGAMVVTGDAKGSYVIRANTETLKETSIAEVQKTGAGRFASNGTLTMAGITKPAAQKITVTATGETLMMSGMNAVIYKADVAVDLPQPMGLTSSISTAYLVPGLGVYLAGEELAGTFYKSETTPHRPLTISLPGQSGFDTIKPSTCGGSLSLLDTPKFPEGVPS